MSNVKYKEVLTTTVTAGFEDTDTLASGSTTGSLKMEWHSGEIKDNKLRFRVYSACATTGSGTSWGDGNTAPSSGALKVVASVGNVGRIGTESMTIEHELVSFSGSVSAKANYPVTTLTTYKVLGGAFTPTGEEVEKDEEGFSSGGIEITISNGGLLSNQPFHGAVQLTYNTRYLLCDWDDGTADTGASVTAAFLNPYEPKILGTIYAFCDGASATLPIDVGFVGGDAEWEIAYEVISYYIVDSTGAWEKPPCFSKDNETTFPGFADGPDSSSFQQLEFVHETGYFRGSGTTKHENTIYSPFKPQGDSYASSGFTPEYFYRKASMPTIDGWREAYIDLDWDRIETRLVDKYPGINISEGPPKTDEDGVEERCK